MPPQVCREQVWAASPRLWQVTHLTCSHRATNRVLIFYSAHWTKTHTVLFSNSLNEYKTVDMVLSLSFSPSSSSLPPSLFLSSPLTWHKLNTRTLKCLVTELISHHGLYTVMIVWFLRPCWNVKHLQWQCNIFYIFQLTPVQFFLIHVLKRKGAIWGKLIKDGIKNSAIHLHPAMLSEMSSS